MKTFTCIEIMDNKGGCDMEFSGDDMMEVASQCGKHVAGTTDELHKPMRDMMTTNRTEEEKKNWFEWFKSEWNKKVEV
jgi:hypothetical protein